MSKVAVMMSENQVEAQMSSHFGKAEWSWWRTRSAVPSLFSKNEAANGRSVVELVSSHNCTDAYLQRNRQRSAGPSEDEGIRGWVALRISVERSAGDVRAPASSGCGYSFRETRGHGCCCAKQAGAEATSCCGR